AGPRDRGRQDARRVRVRNREAAEGGGRDVPGQSRLAARPREGRLRASWLHRLQGRADRALRHHARRVEVSRPAWRRGFAWLRGARQRSGRRHVTSRPGRAKEPGQSSGGGEIRCRALPAAATSTPASIPTVSTATGVAPTTTVGLGPRHLDLDGSAIQVPPVEMSDRVLGLLVRLHLDEAEAFRATTELVGHDGCRDDGAGLGEEVAKTVTRGIEAEAADKEFLRHGRSPAGLPPLRARLPSAEGNCETPSDAGGSKMSRCPDQTARVYALCRAARRPRTDYR